MEREDLGVGKATHWRISLPFEVERRQSSAPNPTRSVGTAGSTIDPDRPVDALAECCFAASHRDIDYGSDWFLDGTTPSGDLTALLDRCPGLKPVVGFVLELLVVDLDSVPLDGVENVASEGREDSSATITLGVDPAPETTQTSLPTAG